MRANPKNRKQPVRAKSKNRKQSEAPKDNSKINPVITSVVVPLITLFVGVVLGNGGFSQWKQTTINQQQHELEKTQKIVGLLNEIQTNMSKVVEFYKKDADLRRELGNKSTDADKSYLNSQIANIWEYEIPTIENTIIRLESRLAKLEDREPKSKSDFDFQIPAPWNFRFVTVH